MEEKKADPGALAGAHRVDVTMLAVTGDADVSSGNTVELQIHQILARSSCSRPVAAVVAEHAFSTGRPA
ncbi:hypothetical protein [Mesorhizobium wenxiniae]|uniref:hypothetical protein n=1 Tax=Mesorhizobium wenxiniae TaxID=2014805 RepID=UPI0010547C57|nr:hypothetical protein [Mesorhizobium wenxiniae]